MGKHPLNIFIISAADIGGGAEKIARSLFHSFRDRGHTAWLAVGLQYENDSQVFTIPNNAFRHGWARLTLSLEDRMTPLIGKVRGMARLRKILQWIGEPYRRFAVSQGHEDFHFPATWSLLSIPPERPDIVHGHNLHTGYFDLRALPGLTKQVPFVLTLHDAWLLGGHCAHSFDCERWRTGCGHCHDLSIFPAIRKDASAYNWDRKRKIFAQSRLYIASPSQWLMNKVQQSILQPAILEAKVIPYGVDLKTFHPGDKNLARKTLGLPENARILLFVAHGIHKNIWKDYLGLRETIQQVADRQPANQILCLALGEDSAPEQLGRAQIQFIPFQKDAHVVAAHYQAADIYLHAAKVDTFPNTVLEALACGIPVVATACGGIPEQVKSLATVMASRCDSCYDANQATGILIEPGNALDMSKAVLLLLNDKTLRDQLGYNAALDIQNRFSEEKHINTYLDWYRKIVEHHASQSFS